MVNVVRVNQVLARLVNTVTVTPVLVSLFVKTVKVVKVMSLC